ncbi:MAG: two-component sensor histidine kinase BarA [Alteromonadaceae bacterium]|nr:two-component sensor histidine kinase BarA [Alteromonadaceae bacterium]
MHKISLKDWIILLTILPTTIIGISLASYFSYNYYNQLNNFLSTQSKSIIEPIAIASVAPIIKKDREMLRHLIGFAHRSNSSIIKSIAVFTQDNQVFVTSAYHGDINFMRLAAGENIPETTQMQEFDDFIVFRTPIIDESDQLINSNLNDSANNNLSSNNQWHKSLGYIAMQIDKSKLKFNQQNKVFVAFILVFIGAIISAILSLKLIQNVTRPISSMVHAIDRIREGKLESRVSGQLIGELNFLKSGINSMAQSLGDYHDEMQRSIDQATIDLRESLEQFEIQNVQLDLAKRKAQDANRVKSEFLANMSHELRTPLNGVIGFTRQVLKTPLTETQRDYLQTIEGSANNLLTIINDILDFSKLDAGKMIIESIPFSLRDSVDEALTLIAPSAHNKNIELSVRISEQLPDSLIGDAMRIKQVLVNLTTNAIKFTEQGSVTIDVDAGHVDQQTSVIKITVTDTGIGINSEQQKTIFEAFSQADKSVTRLYGGTGLGLVISQHLAKEMHGDIGFFSEEKGGSTFWFTFQCEVNLLPIDTSLDTKELAGKHVLYFEPKTHSRIATSEIMASWQMVVHPITQLDQLTTLLAQDSFSQQQHYDFALISHDISPAAINAFKALISTIKVKIPVINLIINSNSPNLQEALIASGAQSCLSTPVTPKKLAKALLPNKYYQDINSAAEHNMPIKVLAVDDNEANLKLIKALLLEQVSEVVGASNGKQAVDLCQNEKYALIYMDIQMPVMDGISAFKIIKEGTLNADTPIIAVTAHALAEERERLLNHGFTNCMTKPIDETMLRHTIYEYCDLDLYMPPTFDNPVICAVLPFANHNFKGIIDWSLALKRAGNKPELAKDMFDGLLKSLPEIKKKVTTAIAENNITELKIVIHKLNGACCYSGVPNLAKVSLLIETSLKQKANITAIEPEFLEFFEHIDSLLDQADDILTEINLS